MPGGTGLGELMGFKDGTKPLVPAVLLKPLRGRNSFRAQNCRTWASQKAGTLHRQTSNRKPVVFSQW